MRYRQNGCYDDVVLWPSVWSGCCCGTSGSDDPIVPSTLQLGSISPTKYKTTSGSSTPRKFSSLKPFKFLKVEATQSKDRQHQVGNKMIPGSGDTYWYSETLLGGRCAAKV